MKRQLSLIVTIIFALIIALFAVINVEPVTVNYGFGTSKWPLVLVILGSVLMGAFVIGAAGMFRFISMRREMKALKQENQFLKSELKERPVRGDLDVEDQIDSTKKNSTNEKDAHLTNQRVGE
jgi:putative membrane protein